MIFSSRTIQWMIFVGEKTQMMGIDVRAGRRKHPSAGVFGGTSNKAMAKGKKDLTREDRIHEEIIVDAYGAEEQAMGWYYHLEDKIRFPFQGKCISAKAASPLRKGDTVEVLRMAPEDACSAEMFVLIRRQKKTLAVPLAQITGLKVDQPTAEAIADWHYWVAQGYLFG